MEWYISLTLCFLGVTVCIALLWQCFFAYYKRQRNKTLQRFIESDNII